MWLGVGMAAVAFAYLMVRGPVRTAVVVPDELPEAVSVGAVAD
jgi:expansin (peptidoglycan-binding protein)